MGNVFYKIKGACLADFSPKGYSLLGIKILCPKKIGGFGGKPPRLCGKPTTLTPEKFPPQGLKGVLHEIWVKNGSKLLCYISLFSGW